MVAVAWATHHPEELLGCVLINTSLRPLNPLYQRLRVQNYASLLCLAFFARSAQRRERTILRLTSRHFCSSAQVLGQWLSFARENPVSRGNALRQLLAAARFRAPREKPLPPLLILSSREDALVDSRCSRQIAASWQSPLVEHPSAGHDLALDDGHWVASQVRRWVERERAQRSVR